MSYMKIGRRNFEIKVSGKRYNKECSVLLFTEFNGMGYTVDCTTMIQTEYPSVGKMSTQGVMFDVLSLPDEECGIEFVQLILEILMQFYKIVTEESKNFDIDKIVTSFVDKQFEWNSDVADIIKDVPHRQTEIIKEGDIYVEKLINNNGCFLYYSPCCMGIAGKAKINSFEMDFIIQ